MSDIVERLRQASGGFSDTLWAEGADEIDRLRGENDRLRQERSDALNVRTREGWLASEWVARTGKAERKLAEARELLFESRREMLIWLSNDADLPSSIYAFLAATAKEGER